MCLQLSRRGVQFFEFDALAFVFGAQLAGSRFGAQMRRLLRQAIKP
jgi:hypothetical protein